MSTLESNLPVADPGTVSAVAVASAWDRCEALLARLSDRINPILVKEARQALRSKQFTGTFFLMLIAAWAVSIVGLAAMGPGVYYSADGPAMFWVYHSILGFALLIVAPYSAFQSLSSERQDRTYELVSITSLSAGQIVAGKLCGVLLQMAIYLSAIFPCLAFTYLLRGLDIFTILLAVVYTCCASIGLAAIGLLLATLIPPRQRMIIPGVAFALLLFGAFIFSVMLAWQFAWSPGDLSITSPEFLAVNLTFLTVYLNGMALACLAARSQMTTVCQNRTTALRVALVVAQLSLAAWFAWGQLSFGGSKMLGFIFFSTMLWYFAGVFLVGEPPRLSPRVRRDLPKSWLGRTFLSWFAPGPASGYVFVIASMAAMSLIAVFPYDGLAALFGIDISNRPRSHTALIGPGGLIRLETVEAAVIATSYMAIYLGLGKLVLDLVRRYSEVRLTTRFLINVLLVLLGAGIPWTIQMTSRDLRNLGYTLLQITNPVWTLYETCSRGALFEGPVLMCILPVVACMVWGLNLPSLANELAQGRMATPTRVDVEDAELAVAASGPSRSSPWDE